MGTLLEKVKAKYQELYFAKYGRFDSFGEDQLRLDDEPEAQFLDLKRAAEYAVSREYEGAPIYAIRFKGSDEPTFAIGFKSILDVTKALRKRYPSEAIAEVKKSRLDKLKFPHEPARAKFDDWDFNC